MSQERVGTGSHMELAGVEGRRMRQGIPVCRKDLVGECHRLALVAYHRMVPHKRQVRYLIVGWPVPGASCKQVTTDR